MNDTFGEEVRLEKRINASPKQYSGSDRSGPYEDLAR